MSIFHKLIIFSFRRYGVCLQWIRLIETYYKGIFSKSFFEFAASAWHRYHWGICAGCTLSMILFLGGILIPIQARVPEEVYRSTMQQKFVQNFFTTRN